MGTRENSVSIAAFAAAVSMAAAAGAAQFVVNGDFTQLSNGVGQFDTNTVATGWSANSGYNFVFTQADASVPGEFGGLSLWDAANINSGDTNTWNGLAAGAGNFAAMDGDFTTAPLTQTITGLTIGKTYVLSFDYAFGQQQGFSGATIQSLTVNLGNSSFAANSGNAFNSGATNVLNHGFTGWQSETTTITATATSETLSFLAQGNLPVPPFALVSNVSLTGGVPEPATWAMMILGLAGLGLAARLRRGKTAAAAA